MLHGWDNVVAIPGPKVQGFTFADIGVDEYPASEGADGGGIVVVMPVEVF